MSDNKPSITFFSTDSIECPVCGKLFRVEKMRHGRGRLVSKEITDELRRVYEPTQAYGEVIPIHYSITVCPDCYYAAYQNDFLSLKAPEKESLLGKRKDRKDTIHEIFPDLDYIKPRREKEAAASYYLAMVSYELLNPDKAPTIKQGLSALRAAWIFSDMHRKFPNDNYDYLSTVFYKKAAYLYNSALRKEFAGKERVSETPGLGPDVDKNYGFDGVLYLAALLLFRYSDYSNQEEKIEILRNAKSTVARIVGMGKKMKSKPTVILENARDLYNEIGDYIKAYEAENGTTENQA
ncbi:MAG: DUF2225 domain-containing protein [Spirochaetales bacterium]|nr:DUF2225 domain-containing protein [Spirochaetales bacterium]